jgi:hypothetical protein
MVATSKPPIIVAAIEANRESKSRGISAKIVVIDATLTGISLSCAAVTTAE